MLSGGGANLSPIAHWRFPTSGIVDDAQDFGYEAFRLIPCHCACRFE